MIKRFAPLCLVLFTLWTVSGLYAQDESPPGEAAADIPVIGPDKAVEMALENNLSLRQTALNNEAKRRAAATPWNVFIPTVEAAGTLGRLNKTPEVMALDLASLGLAPPGTPPIPMGGGGPQWRLSASLSATLNLNIGTFAGIKQTLEEYHAGQITVEKARLGLERDVRKAYYNMLLLREQIALLRDSYDNAGRQVSLAQANYRAGLIPEVSLLQAQVGRENMKPQIDEAENGYRMSMAQFALLLGLSYDSGFELEELPEDADFIALEAAEFISRAAANKPDIEELRRGLSALKARRTATFFNLYTPTLSLGYTLDPSFGGDPLKDNVFDTSLWSQQQGMFRITLAWRLNALLPFTTEYQNYRAMDDAVKAMELGLLQAARGTEVEVYNIILQLEKTRTTAEAQRLTVELAERTLRLSETAYRNGLKQYIEVQNDELALRQARLEQVRQSYDYRKGLLDLEYATGVPFGSLGGRN